MLCSFHDKHNSLLLCFYDFISFLGQFQAESCKSVEQALFRFPRGMFAEIKYDGERVQLHKQGNTFQYFSRSLKPVQPHKVLDEPINQFILTFLTVITV